MDNSLELLEMFGSHKTETILRRHHWNTVTIISVSICSCAEILGLNRMKRHARKGAAFECCFKIRMSVLEWTNYLVQPWSVQYGTAFRLRAVVGMRKNSLKKTLSRMYRHTLESLCTEKTDMMSRVTICRNKVTILGR